MQEANKGLKRQSIWSMFDQSKKFEEAKDKYMKAGNLFIMSKSWGNAGAPPLPHAKVANAPAVGLAFEKAAEMDDALGNTTEGILNRTKAAENYRRTDPSKAVVMYRALVAAKCEAGRFAQAAQLLEIVGEILESQNNVEDALDAFSKAADYHNTENAGSRANKCLAKVATLSASNGAYDHAARTFETLGMTALESNLLKFGAKKHFLHAGFCLLAKGDSVAARMSFDRFSQMDLSFPGSRESKLYDELIAAYEAMDTDAFSTALASYDSVCTLDACAFSIHAPACVG